MRIPIVDEEDHVIKVIDINDRKQGEISRNTSVWVGNEKGELLLAQRAFRKRRDPGLWGPSAAGFVGEGETYESNALKEAEEEIGLRGVALREIRKFRRSTDHEYFAKMFITFVKSNYRFTPEEGQVEAVKWFSRDELTKLLNEKPEIFVSHMRDLADIFFRHVVRS